mgnify:CR=1 FL=1
MKRSVLVFCSWTIEAEGSTDEELKEDAKRELKQFLQTEQLETVIDCGLDDIIVDG